MTTNRFSESDVFRSSVEAVATEQYLGDYGVIDALVRTFVFDSLSAVDQFRAPDKQAKQGLEKMKAAISFRARNLANVFFGFATKRIPTCSTVQ
jgi:hypothetical protein